MTVGMSDEVKLTIIKGEMEDIMLATKMLLSIMSTFEAYRQLINNELPEEFVDTVSSDDFKEVFNSGVLAYGEIINNMINFIDNISRLFNVNFKDEMPKTADEFMKMTIEIEEKTRGIAGMNDE